MIDLDWCEALVKRPLRPDSGSCTAQANGAVARVSKQRPPVARPALWIGAIVLALGSAVGCGSNPYQEPAQIGLLRVQVARLSLPAEVSEVPSDPAARRVWVDEVIDRSVAREAFNLAAEAASYAARLEEEAGDQAAAIERYQEALRFDKQHQLALRSPIDPLPNAANIAVSLANLASAFEAVGDPAQAAIYADRALRINRALGLIDRVRVDLELLVRLSEALGQADRRAAYSELLTRLDQTGSLDLPNGGGPTQSTDSSVSLEDTSTDSEDLAAGASDEPSVAPEGSD